MFVTDLKYVINVNNKVPPWKAMLTSKRCIAIFVAHVCVNWGNYLFLTQMPTYMKDILQFDIKSVLDHFFYSITYSGLVILEKQFLL